MAEDERIAENRGRSHSRRASAGARGAHVTRGGAHDTLHGDPRNRHVVIHTIFTPRFCRRQTKKAFFRRTS